MSAASEALRGVVTTTDLRAVEARLRETELRLDLKIEAMRGYLWKCALVGAVTLQTIVLIGAALALARVLAH